jgi:Fur family ferric uptake transcriptional regulator
MTAAEPLSEEQEVFLKHIQKKGLKRTSQRELILDVFLRTEQHLSNEDLYQLVKKEDPTVGQTTVYRTLKILTDAGLAREVRFGDGRTHYEHNYKHQHHDHMICSECGKIIEFFSAELEAIQDQMAAKHDFEITQHLLRMIGVCSECRREQKHNAADADDVTDSQNTDTANFRNSEDVTNPQSSDEASTSRNSPNVANSRASS